MISEKVMTREYRFGNTFITYCYTKVGYEVSVRRLG